MKTWTRVGAAAIVVAASTVCALGDAPPRQAAGAELDDAMLKQQQINWELANGIVPIEGGGVATRGVCPNSVTRTPNLPIPQFVAPNPGVVTDQMTTSGDPLSNVRVRLNIPHTWQGDVIARLRHDASGIEVTLIDRPGVPELSTVGFSADNFGDNANGIPFVLDSLGFSRYDAPDVAAPGIANVTGNWLTDDQFSSLAAFDGLTANTTFTLTVSDNAGGDLGTLVRWTICSDNALGQNFPTGVGAASPNPTASGSLVTFTVQVSPAVGPPSTGLAVVTNLSAVGGSSSQAFFDNGTNGDGVPGDNVFTYQTVVTAGSGVLSLPFVVSDAQTRSSGGTIGLTIVATNDFCEAAINVPVGSSIITTNDGATNDPGLPTCSGLLTFNLGVWFTTTGNGNVLNATTCSGNTSLNTRLYVYTGSCGGFTCVGANATAAPACSPANAASVQFCSTIGQTYYILVTNDTTGTGQFELSVLDSGACLANDNCETAVNVPVGSSVVGNNIGASNDPGQPTCNALSTFNAGVWYTTTGNGNVLNVTTCGGNTTLNTRLYVYTGSCGAFTCVNAATGTTPACSPTTAASVQFCSTVGQTYYILVTNDTTGTGVFDLAVLEMGACPTNDLCENAVPVSVGDSVITNNIGATNDPGQPTCTGLSTFNAGVWFTTVGNGNNLIASTCSANTLLNTRLYVYSGSCGAFTCVGANATASPACSPANAASVRFCSTLGETYHILVTNDTTGTGQFELSVTDGGPIGCQPTGGCCVAGACSIQTGAACLDAGGSYLGDSTNCDGAGLVTTYVSNPFLSIPDNQCIASGFVTDTIVVPDNVAIADINVRVQLTHTFLGDLRIRLTNGATTVSVWERACGSNDNMDVTFDDEGAVVICATPTIGTYVPSGTGAGMLSAFDGQMSAGNWTLEICDGAGIDLGTLNTWELSIRAQDPDLCGGGPQFCDADWCQDGSVGVPDIFCFLSAWFANDPDARNYGGTNGVPAIFAFLSIWFATGTGPCTP